MTARRSMLLLLVLLAMLAFYGSADAQADGAAKRKRLVSGTAPSPQWTAAERGAFFENAAEQLGPAPTVDPAPVTDGAGSSSTAPANDGGFAWSRLISAEDLESEVKALAKSLAPAVATASEFKGGGFKTSRREFTNLSAMFGIIGAYDGKVRWQTQGAALRDAFGRAGRNCKIGTDGVYAEAKLRAEELTDLIRGDAPKSAPGTMDFQWAESADRSPLMERLELARTERLKPWTGSKREFTAHRSEIVHEASLVAAYAEIIKHPSYDFAEDESFVAYVAALQGAALEAADAAKKNEFDRVQSAVGALGQSCDNCHGDFR